jgi:TonB family C-terminal domain
MKVWLGIGLAISMHAAFLLLLPNQSQTTSTTPPQPIQVNWISTSAKTETKPAPAKPLPLVEKPSKKPKLKPLAKSVNTAPVLTTPSETALQVPVTSEAEHQQPAEASAEQPPQSITASAGAPNTDSQQAPLTLPSLHADYLNNPAPVYPDDARRKGEQGRVLLRVFVNASGTVEHVALRKSSGYPRLDQAALETVQTWRFVAAKRDTVSVAAWVVVPISFSLEG